MEIIPSPLRKGGRRGANIESKRARARARSIVGRDTKRRVVRQFQNRSLSLSFFLSLFLLFSVPFSFPTLRHHTMRACATNCVVGFIFSPLRLLNARERRGEKTAAYDQKDPPPSPLPFSQIVRQRSENNSSTSSAAASRPFPLAF